MYDIQYMIIFTVQQDKIYNQSTMIAKVILILSLTLMGALAVPTEDQVHIAIPYSGHRWFSGYLNFTHGAFHYVFFESQRDPDNDPVLLWLNGGPGCSSLIGMVYENGPFVFQPNSTDFKVNEYAWNKKANLLYIQSPQGVGFSVGTPEKLDDGTVAVYNLKALLAFFVKFPNLKKNDFYMSGESYAGIYIPYLANEIIKHNKLPSSKETIIKLKGIMIGNGCTDPNECYIPGNHDMSIYQYEFLYKHTYMTERDYDHMRAACLLGYFSDQCKALRKVLDQKFVDTKNNICNIYAPCYYQPTTQTSKLMQNGRYRQVSVDEGDCQDSMGIHHFFNEPLLFEKLHVNPVHFTECSDEVEKKYTMFANASYWLYPILIKENLRIWIYSGDVDANVPITGTLRWLDLLREEAGLPVLDPWRQWWAPGLHKHEDQVAGMTWKLKGITFASVKGAGHMAPQDKPKECFILIDSFLNGTPLPDKAQ